MSLTEEQRKIVTKWIEDGMKLSEIQDRMGTEFDLRMTYMDARLLVDDLKLTPKDPVSDEPAVAADSEPEMIPDLPPAPGEVGSLPGDEAVPAGAAANVSLSVDSLTRPGALVSGKATFSDGETAEWYLDQMGRFGLVPATEGYRPTQPDIAALQQLLDRELQKLGY